MSRRNNPLSMLFGGPDDDDKVEKEKSPEEMKKIFQVRDRLYAEYPGMVEIFTEKGSDLGSVHDVKHLGAGILRVSHVSFGKTTLDKFNPETGEQIPDKDVAVRVIPRVTIIKASDIQRIEVDHAAPAGPSLALVDKVGAIWVAAREESRSSSLIVR